MEVQVSKLKMARYKVRITETRSRWQEIVVEAKDELDAETRAWAVNPGFDDPLEPDQTFYEVIKVIDDEEAE